MLVSSIDGQAIVRSSDQITFFDRSLHVTVWNPACEAVYGIMAPEAIGRYLLDLFPFIKNDHRVQCIQDAAHKGETFFFTTLPYQYRRGHYSQLIMPLENVAGSFNGAISIVREHDPRERVREKEMLEPLLIKAFT